MWDCAVKIKHLSVFNHEKLQGILPIGTSMKLWSCCYTVFTERTWKWVIPPGDGWCPGWKRGTEVGGRIGAILGWSSSSNTRQSSVCCSYQSLLGLTQPEVWTKGKPCFRGGALSGYVVFSEILWIFIILFFFKGCKSFHYSISSGFKEPSQVSG